MKIRLKTEPRGEFKEMEIPKGTAIQEIYRSCAEDLPYVKTLARVDNEYMELKEKLQKPCDVELLDIRTRAANLAYQSSLILVFLTASKKVTKDRVIIIDNAINQGLFLRMRDRKPLSAQQVSAIEKEMRRLVEEDLPITEIMIPAEEGIEELKKAGREAAVRVLPKRHKKKIRFYQLGKNYDYFHEFMVPSAGYVKDFELRKYRGGVLLRFPHPSSPDRIPEFNDQTKLFEAFELQRQWGDQLGVRYLADLNEKIADGSFEEMMKMSEALHEKQLAHVADIIKEKKKRIILIAGPSSSGKTTFAKRLCIQLQVNGLKTLYMGTDDYFLERTETPLDQHGEPNYEDLEALDIKLFNRNMNDLLEGKEVDLPTFDFLTGTKKYGKRVTSIGPDDIIVIEGIHGLNEKLTEQIARAQKYKIYISPLTQMNIDEHCCIPTTDERMLRRMVRDYQFRGHDARTTIAGWSKVRAGEDKNIFPYSNEADLFFNTYHVYEIPVLKKYAAPILEEVSAEEPEYAEAQRILRFLNLVDVAEDDSFVLNNSIIREFIGGSIMLD